MWCYDKFTIHVQEMSFQIYIFIFLKQIKLRNAFLIFE